MDRNRSLRVLPFVLGALQLITFAAIAWVAQKPDAERIAKLMPALLVAALPAVLWVLLLRRLPSSRWIWVLILTVGFAGRLALFQSEPLLSDDVYRYLWDGRVQQAGLSPYGVPPKPGESSWQLYGKIDQEGRAPTDDELLQLSRWSDYEDALSGVEESIAPEHRVRDRVNHPEIPTIYPPLMELTFAAAALSEDALFSWRLIVLAFEILLLFSLARLLAGLGRDPRWVVLYWWHPLTVVENVWSAHAEIVAVAFLVWGLSQYASRDRAGDDAKESAGRWRLGTIGVALAAAAKLLPLGLVPFLWRRWGWRVLPWGGAMIAITVVPFAMVEWVAEPRRAFEGLERYAASWYFNDMVFRPVGFALGLDPEDRTLASTQYWRASLKGLWVAVCLFAAWNWGKARPTPRTSRVELDDGLEGKRFERSRSTVRAALCVIAAFVVLTPTLHPWYLLWLLPLAIAAGSAAGFVLTVTVLISYATKIAEIETGVWTELPRTRWWEFLPPLGVLLIEVGTRLGNRLRRG